MTLACVVNREWDRILGLGVPVERLYLHLIKPDKGFIYLDQWKGRTL